MSTNSAAKDHFSICLSARGKMILCFSLITNQQKISGELTLKTLKLPEQKNLAIIEKQVNFRENSDKLTWILIEVLGLKFAEMTFRKS